MAPTRVALLATLVLAAILRFVALGWGLRHTPHIDEQFFVENVRGMLARGDLDHRFHEYPGLVFYLLLPAVAAADRTTLAREGYLLARGVVAACGVLSVALAYRLGRTMAGTAAGLAAALLLAVSPIEVQTAHMVRPDVVLEAFVLLAFLAFTRIGPERRGDVFAGAAVGAVVAVKFSGVLLAPSYALRRLLTPGPRGSGPLVAAATSLLVFALLSPYTLLDLSAFWEGARSQVGYHYVVRPRGEQSYFGMVVTYVGVLAKGLGVAGLALALAAAVLVRREWRRWLPLAVFPLVCLAVFSTAEVNRDRFMLPALGVLAVIAGAAVAWIAVRSSRLAVAVALLAAGPPLVQSVRYVAAIARPGTRDQAVDWIQAHAAPGARILTTLPELGLDRTRYEVLVLEPGDERVATVASSVDHVVAAAEIAGLFATAEIAPRDVHAGPRIVVGRPAAARALRPVPLTLADLGASENAEELAHVLDGDLDTRWESPAPQEPGTFLELRLREPRPLARVELALGDRPRHFAANLHVLALGEDGAWTRLRTADGRPPVPEQLGAPSQVLLLPAVKTRGLRLVQMGRRVRPWSVAELRLDEDAHAP
jgi:4-amino-4-deoxy-L-arabinose transferase-like glycosyltransferase